MEREKKDRIAISVKLERSTWDLLEEFVKESGQSKTFVVEKAIQMYIDDKRKNNK